jgi:cob(I)alamin adenosyltransferase
MSIATKTGDRGTTGLMYNRRVAKHDPRVEAYGCVDELNSALGMARAAAGGSPLAPRLLEIQHDLITVMGELATAVEDLPRYTADGFALVSDALTARLDECVAALESSLHIPRGWAMPGDTPLAAALDMARVVCRRAERRVCALHAQDGLRNDEIIVFLNRLADVLWLMARAASSTDGGTKS